MKYMNIRKCTCVWSVACFCSFFQIAVDYTASDTHTETSDSHTLTHAHMGIIIFTEIMSGCTKRLQLDQSASRLIINDLISITI